MKNFFFGLLLCGALISCGDDDADPVLNITSSTNVIAVAGTDFDISGTATDDLGVSSVSINSDGLNLSGTVNAADLGPAGEFGWTITLDSMTVAGEYEITVTATDTGDNQAEEIVSVNVSN